MSLRRERLSNETATVLSCFVLSLSQTPTVQPELSPFTLCTLTSKEFSSLTLCTPTCLECSPFLSTSYLFVPVVSISKHLSKPLAESPCISLNPDMLEELSSFTAYALMCTKLSRFMLTWLTLSTSSRTFYWLVAVVPFPNMLKLIQLFFWSSGVQYMSVYLELSSSSLTYYWRVLSVPFVPVLSGLLGVVLAFLQFPACGWSNFPSCCIRWGA